MYTSSGYVLNCFTAYVCLFRLELLFVVVGIILRFLRWVIDYFTGLVYLEYTSRNLGFDDVLIVFFCYGL
jgi:hypothetical protein